MTSLPRTLPNHTYRGPKLSRNLDAEQTRNTRQVWELRTYAHLVHSDRAKRARWAELDDFRQGMAKYIAYSYAGDLYHLVTVVEAMLRDPAMDDRGLLIQILTVRRRAAGLCHRSRRRRSVWPASSGWGRALSADDGFIVSSPVGQSCNALEMGARLL